MKQLKWVVCLAVWALANLVYAQNATQDKLAGKAWINAKDGMIGVGTHLSVPEGTKLIFNADGTWISSQPIFSATQGSWKLKSDTQMLMLFGNEQKWTKALISEIDEKSLHFKVKRKPAVHYFQWTAG